jgi:hypothetical protein
MHTTIPAKLHVTLIHTHLDGDTLETATINRQLQARGVASDNNVCDTSQIGDLLSSTATQLYDMLHIPNARMRDNATRERTLRML